MRQAILSQPRLVQSAKQVAIPAPTGGWNARDNLASMPVQDAVKLENFIPDVSYLKLRSGDTSYATGLSGNVESLITHISDSAEKFLAASDGNIYDVSSSGAVGAAIGTGFTNARWVWDNFGDRTILVNGADAPQSYDGSTLGAAGFTGTGLTVTNLNSVTQVRDRLWFTENNQARVWYGGIGAITGALTQFDLAQIATGGSCVRVARWSRDAGDGMDDLVVFIMSTGQVIAYSGDPAATFSLKGRYSAPPPIGKNCFVQVGGDLIIITRGGYVPASALLNEGDFESKYVSSKIRNAVKEAVDSYGANLGWQAVRTPDSKFLVFNVPLTTNSEYHQHVVNLYSGAWCKFTGRNARCFGVYGGQLYFGHSTAVYLADSGQTDASASSANVVGTAQQAFTNFGASETKLATIMKPTIDAGGSVTMTFAIKTDFDTTALSSNLQSIGSSIPSWEQIESNWEDYDITWDSGSGVSTPSLSCNALGDYMSIASMVNTDGTFKWFNTSLTIVTGGIT